MPLNETPARQPHWQRPQALSRSETPQVTERGSSESQPTSCACACQLRVRRPARQHYRRRWSHSVGLSLALTFRALTAPAAEAPAAAQATLEQISRSLGSAETIFARFVQERHLSLFKEPLRSEGVLCCQKPGRVRWEITDPYRSILVSDGAGVAQFEWLDGRWKKLDVGLAGALQAVVHQIAGVIQGRYAADQGEFRATVATAAEGPVLTLSPQLERIKKVLAAIEVHLSPELKSTRRVILRETGGDHTDIQFPEQIANLELPTRAFDRSRPCELAEILESARRASAAPPASPEIPCPDRGKDARALPKPRLD